MEQLKMYIRNIMMWEFKNNKKNTEIAKKICSVFGQCVITNH